MIPPWLMMPTWSGLTYVRLYAFGRNMRDLSSQSYSGPALSPQI